MAKYEPTTLMRDVAIETYDSVRLIVGDDIQRKLHNHMLHGYDSEKADVDDQLWHLNQRRVRCFIGRMGRYGWFLHQRKGLKRLLEDPEFVRRNRLTTHRNPRKGEQVVT